MGGFLIPSKSFEIACVIGLRRCEVVGDDPLWLDGCMVKADLKRYAVVPELMINMCVIESGTHIINQSISQLIN